MPRYKSRSDVPKVILQWIGSAGHIYPIYLIDYFDRRGIQVSSRSIRAGRGIANGTR
jgi:hypothetical protein